ncbi:unnamed protein product [marine sediment metagenome]|uniref:Transcription regulator TrmB N-terminal domain-containing protein n=1 Tax=marine sediment metagenome TaxID=412755 RepID=X1FUQ1_9ZZZZ
MLLCLNNSTKLKYFENNSFIMASKENAFINSLQKMALNYEEALIYFNLIKHGQTGTIVRKLNEVLFSIERTTIYSILRRLIEKGCVKEGYPSEDHKKIKTFIAIEPIKYFNKIFLKKKRDLEELQEIRLKILNNLQDIYKRGLEVSYDDLDPFIKPYFKPLLKKGWKVKTQKITKGINLLGGDFYYEYQLQVPKKLYKNINILGFSVSIFDSDIQNDDITLKFFINQLKKIIEEILSTLNICSATSVNILCNSSSLISKSSCLSSSQIKKILSFIGKIAVFPNLTKFCDFFPLAVMIIEGNVFP